MPDPASLPVGTGETEPEFLMDTPDDFQGYTPTPPPEPAEVAIRENFWTLSIRDLDGTIDRIERRADLLSGDGPTAHSGCLREALAIVRGVRNRLLAENYDANRKDRGVMNRVR